MFFSLWLQIHVALLEKWRFFTKLFQELLSKEVPSEEFNLLGADCIPFFHPLPFLLFLLLVIIISFIQNYLFTNQLSIVLSFTAPKPTPPKCPKKLIRKCFLVKYGKSKRVVCTCVPPCSYKGWDWKRHLLTVSE